MTTCVAAYHLQNLEFGSTKARRVLCCITWQMKCQPLKYIIQMWIYIGSVMEYSFEMEHCKYKGIPDQLWCIRQRFLSKNLKTFRGPKDAQEDNMIYQALTSYFYQQKQSIKIFLDVFIKWIYCLMKIDHDELFGYLTKWQLDVLKWSRPCKVQ